LQYLGLNGRSDDREGETMNPVIWLKRIALAILSLGTTAVIAACYGVYDLTGMESVLLAGEVKGEGEGVEGIQVCAALPSPFGYDSCTTSVMGGYYEVWVAEDFFNEALEEGLELSVEDIDGAANGLWLSDTVELAPEDLPAEEYDIELTAADE